MEELKKKIIEDLRKSGFPTEVAVALVLDKEGWMVYNNVLFFDSEENKPREIDIHAVDVDFSLAQKVKKQRSGNENKLISHIIIEVKKSDKPWVFFNNGKTRWPQIPIQNFKTEAENNLFCEMIFDDLKHYGFTKHRYIKAPLHKSYNVSFTAPSSPSVIYESLIKVSKALKHFKNHYGTGGFSLHNFIPLVVLDGTLWSANLNTKGNLSIKKVEKLFVVHSEMIKSEANGLAFEEEQICEIITIDGLKKHLNVIRKDNKELYQTWTNYISSKTARETSPVSRKK